MASQSIGCCLVSLLLTAPLIQSSRIGLQERLTANEQGHDDRKDVRGNPMSTLLEQGGSVEQSVVLGPIKQIKPINVTWHGEKAECKRMARDSDVFACFVNHQKTLTALLPLPTTLGIAESRTLAEYKAYILDVSGAARFYFLEDDGKSLKAVQEISQGHHNGLALQYSRITRAAFQYSGWRRVADFWYNGFLSSIRREAEDKYGVMPTHAEVALLESIFMGVGFEFVDKIANGLEMLADLRSWQSDDNLADQALFEVHLAFGKLFSMVESLFFLVRLDEMSLARHKAQGTPIIIEGTPSEGSVSVVSTPLAAVPPLAFKKIPALISTRIHGEVLESWHKQAAGCNGIEGATRILRCKCRDEDSRGNRFHCVRAETVAQTLYKNKWKLKAQIKAFKASLTKDDGLVDAVRNLGRQEQDMLAYGDLTALLKCKRNMWGSGKCDLATRCLCAAVMPFSEHPWREIA